MNNLAEKTRWLVAETYQEYRPVLYGYISRKLNGRTEEAEDLTQDVFLRLMDCQLMLRKETVKFFLFTIARNLVTDWLRRHYRKQEIDIYMMETTPRISDEADSRVVTNEILHLELLKVNALPQQRKVVYTLSRFEEKSADDIARELNLSKRTVERHILLGRRDVRSFIKQCI